MRNRIHPYNQKLIASPDKIVIRLIGDIKINKAIGSNSWEPL